MVKTKKQQQAMESLVGKKNVAKMMKGQNPEGFAVHHKTPLFRGGTNKRSNLSLVDDTTHRENSKQLHYYEGTVNPIDAGTFTDFVI